MIFKEDNNECEEFLLEEDSFELYEEMTKYSYTGEPLTMNEFMEEYENDNFLEDVVNQFNEIDYDALLEYGLVNSFLSEADNNGGVVSNIAGAVKDKGTELNKALHKKNPVASNPLVRMFNVVKNAFGVVQAFTEKAMTTFKINNLQASIKGMPESMKFNTFKCFVDGAIDAFVGKINSAMNKAVSFAKSIIFVGRMVEEKEARQHFEFFEKIIHGVNDVLSTPFRTDKQGILRQLETLKGLFQKYSAIKIIQRGFLTVANACSNPMKLVNAADKLTKMANGGQGIKGKAGVGIDAANVLLGDVNIMKIPGVSFVINIVCKVLGKGLAWFKKILTTCLGAIKQAYQDSRNDPKNGAAIRNYQNTMKKRGV